MLGAPTALRPQWRKRLGGEVADGSTVDVRRALRILRANAWIVILVTALAAGGTYLWAKHQTAKYEAQALVRAFDSTASNGAGNVKVDAQRAVDTQVLYAKSSEVVS